MQTTKEHFSWVTNSHWTTNTGAFKHYFLINIDYKNLSWKQIRKCFIQEFQEMYGMPGQRWAFQLDTKLGVITLCFREDEDAVMFMLMNK